jgi:hypothetical protein
MEKSQKKESDRNPGNKIFPNSNKKHSWKLLQQIRTSGRQNVRAQWQNHCPEKDRTIFRHKIQEVQKEYTRTHLFHQKTQTVNHGGHWRRRGASQSYM